MKTVLQHFKLWRQVLTKDREMTFIYRDLSIENLEEPLYPYPLNMALPELYLNPPPKIDPEEEVETGETTSGTLLNDLVNSENGKSIAIYCFSRDISTDLANLFLEVEPIDIEIPIGASVSRVTQFYEKITASMMEEMKTEMENLIEKSENELKEAYLQS